MAVVGQFLIIPFLGTYLRPAEFVPCLILIATFSISWVAQCGLVIANRLDAGRSADTFDRINAFDYPAGVL
jgi:hypothetical protein